MALPRASQLGTRNYVARNLATDGLATSNTGAQNAAALAAFNVWALTQQPAPIRLTINPGDYTIAYTETGLKWTYDIETLVVLAYGVTFRQQTSGSTSISFGGRPLPSDATHNAQVQTVPAGAKSVVCLIPAEAVRFPVGLWACLSGIDLQGLYSTDAYGYPPNWHFFEYVEIVSSNATTGIIEFNTPLRNTYKSTWPTYNPDYDGGPATLWAMWPSWNCDQDFRGMTIIHNTAPNCCARKMTFRDCNFTQGGPNISNTKDFYLISSTYEDVREVDKLVESITFDDVTAHGLQFQSSSIDNFICRNTVFDYTVDGSAKDNTIEGSTFTAFNPGVYSHGTSTGLLDVRNSVISSFTPAGNGAFFLKTNFAIEDGIITLPNGATVSAAASDGASGTRMTVHSTAGFIVGGAYPLRAGGAAEANYTVLAIPDAAHIDINRAFSSTFTGKYGGGAVKWAVPGSWVNFVGPRLSQTNFQVVDLTQDVDCTYIHTNLSVDDWPTLPLSSGRLDGRTHPAPLVYFEGCTGDPIVVDLSQAAARNRPYGEYSKRTYDMTTLRRTPHTPPPSPVLFGWIVEIRVNVLQAYAGVEGTQRVQLDWALIEAGNATEGRWTKFFNLRAAGERVITPSGVTGRQTGDSADLSLGGERWLGPLAFAGPNLWVNVDIGNPAEDFQVSIEYILDQGIV